MAEGNDKPARRVRPRRNESLLARVVASNPVQNAIATVFAGSLLFVKATSTLTFEPRSNDEIFDDFAPFIATSWHGQAFMLPLFRPKSRAADVLVSRNFDGELIARAVLKLGCGVVRGSGAVDPTRMFEKGAVAGFRGMKTSLDQGRTIGVTADFNRHARRKVSPGIITLARMSGRPIVPVAFASSRRREMASWDRTTINLPFSRAACVFTDPVWVPATADDALIEAKRVEVETALVAATARAYAIVDQRRG